jgi:hypothetical protein
LDVLIGDRPALDQRAGRRIARNLCQGTIAFNLGGGGAPATLRTAALIVSLPISIHTYQTVNAAYWGTWNHDDEYPV